MRSPAPRKSSMPPMDEAPQLHCPIGLFEACEYKLRELSTAVNEAEGEAKAEAAQALIHENDKLLACRDFNGNNENCVLCRSFAGLRSKAAGLIVQMMTPGSQKGGGHT